MLLLLKQLDALAKDKRLAIVRLLARSKDLLATSTVAQILDMPPSLTSRHIKVLVEAELVIQVQSGPYMLCALKHDHFDAFISALKSLATADEPSERTSDDLSSQNEDLRHD